jgi:hypothetical protein
MVKSGMQANDGILGHASGVAPMPTIPKVVQTSGITLMDPTKIKVTLD